MEIDIQSLIRYILKNFCGNLKNQYEMNMKAYPKSTDAQNVDRKQTTQLMKLKGVEGRSSPML